MKQLKRIYNFNFVADLVMAEAISRFARAGEAREGAASQACASAVTGRATSPWNAQTPPTAGPEAAAPSVAGWCKV